MPEAARVYKVQFLNQGEVWEIYCRQVSQGGLFGFVELEGLLFGEKTQVVVDPSQERLAREFDGVKRVFIPLHAVVRIDEVARQGVSRIAGKAKSQGTLMPFPTPVPQKD